MKFHKFFQDTIAKFGAPNPNRPNEFVYLFTYNYISELSLCWRCQIENLFSITDSFIREDGHHTSTRIRFNNRRSRRAFVSAATSFQDALKTAVESILASIPYVILGILLFSFLLSKFTGTDRPLEILYIFLKNEQEADDLNSFERFLVKFSLKLLKFLISYKSKIFALL